MHRIRLLPYSACLCNHELSASHPGTAGSWAAAFELTVFFKGAFMQNYCDCCGHHGVQQQWRAFPNLGSAVCSCGSPAAAVLRATGPDVG